QQIYGVARSMTGYARVRKQTSAGELTVSLRSVNGSSLDLHFHLGSELGPFENDIRTLVKEKIGRGHVEVRLTLGQGVNGQKVAYNRSLLASRLEAFRQANQEFGLNSVPDLNL